MALREYTELHCVDDVHLETDTRLWLSLILIEFVFRSLEAPSPVIIATCTGVMWKKCYYVSAIMYLDRHVLYLSDVLHRY